MIALASGHRSTLDRPTRSALDITPCIGRGASRAKHCVGGAPSSMPRIIAKHGTRTRVPSETMDARRRLEGFAFLVAFGLCIPAANWLIRNAGATRVPDGPPLIPAGPGPHAPSGVLMIGLALVLRDLVQRRLGIGWAVGAILAGAALSALLAPAALVVASAVAFLLSEFADLAVYTPLQHRRLLLAVLASSLVGLVVDSAVFLY